MTNQAPVILWFRQDLRLDDNPALNAAAESGRPVVPVFIHDEDNAGEWAPGPASQWWLHHSLQRLNESLDGKLVLLRGDAEEALKRLIRETGAQAVYWNRGYEPWKIARDKKIKSGLSVEGKSFDAQLMFEPWTVQTGSGQPYKVFTPFYKACLNLDGVSAPLRAHRDLNFGSVPESAMRLEDLGLLPKSRWDKKLEQYWQPGEEGAWKRFRKFKKEIMPHYAELRDRPDKDGTSALSPHLHWGEISPRALWHGVGDRCEAFTRELCWREFCYHLLYHFPDFPEESFKQNFRHFPWREDQAALRAWQKGQTGYPIVDAGMRQLWETGWMHNRLRMVVGSFLVKNLLLHWKRGEEWFWYTLVDADLANNAAGWQWIGGSGADAAPYFRIFNPVTQGQKFDPEGHYVRRFVPELKDMPAKHIHAPWQAPEDVLRKAGVRPGETYPRPIVDLRESRQRALEAFETIKGIA